MYVPGCPPRPEMLIDATFKLRAIIAKQTKVGETHTIEDERRKEEAALAGEIRQAPEKLVKMKK